MIQGWKSEPMYKKMFPNKTMFSKLLITYILLSIIPVALIGLVSFKMSEKLLDAQISKSNINTLEQINKNINVLIDQVSAIVNIYNMNNELEALLTKQYTNPYDQLLDQAKVENNMLRYSFAFDWLSFQSFLIGNNGLIYTQNYENNIVDPERLLNFPLKDILAQNPDRITWLSTHRSYLKNQEDSQVFTAAKLLQTNALNKNYGVFLISVKEQNLYTIYKNLLQNGNEIMIVDRSNHIISHSDRSRVGQILNEPYVQKLLATEENYKISSTIHNQKFLTLYKKIDRVDWYIVENIPMNSIFQDIDALKQTILIVAFVCILLSVVAAFFISRSISLPIRKLSRRVQNYWLQGTVEPDYPVNEVKLLNIEYDKMIEKLEKTINALVINQEEKRIAELQALQMQINPHFLYNTLNSIKCLVWVNKTELIEPTIHALVTLLEQTINRNDEFITIQEELTNIEQYVYIQQIRTDEAITLRYNIDPQMLDCTIPKLLLQPIIENALFHGIEPSKVPGVINVFGSIHQDSLKIEIIDNGVGMNEEELARVFNETASPSSSRFSGIGVRNVHERLKLNFGPSYGLTIHSQPGFGTSVILTLPKLMKSTEVKEHHV
ncbi:sensor histidine kinase [Paenibacillus chitinolyticus]|nr:sensor histidine kinase [Paenibacillus chitinolyticus]